MTTILRQIIAGPRTKHPESNLDLCYVTPFIIATSGPSATYPQLAYRNPLDQLVKFLDEKHGSNWCIWEFRAEGTGYPDSEVYGRVKHYPWPDHHPPPFAVVPLVMASMRKWLKEGRSPETNGDAEGDKNPRVVVVHCKAGKGRSGTMACSYLISECGWKVEEALARFTERRMRPGFGQGVSIQSQLRWVGYVDRWARGGKIYVDKQIEILELHTWGLRDGVKVAIEGYIHDGKVIKVFHVFKKKERFVVEGNAPGSAGFADMIVDMAGYGNEAKMSRDTSVGPNTKSSSVNKLEKVRGSIALLKLKSSESFDASTPEQMGSEAGGTAVIFKPSTPIILPTSDINIDFERRNKAGYGFAMVTSVAHVWFNAFFEGNGPERSGSADETGVFEIDWERMDGIKGSLRKGTRALDRLAVVWKVHGAQGQANIIQPSDDQPIPQMAPADWKGDNNEAPGLGKDLGLRAESPANADISRASSLKSFDSNGKEKTERDGDSMKGLKTSGPTGEEDLHVDEQDMPQPRDDAPEPNLQAVNKGLDTASSTTPRFGTET